MTNDDLRLRLNGLTDSQLRGVLRDHYPAVAEWVGQADRAAATLTLIDHVDQRGDDERQRLGMILNAYQPGRNQRERFVNDNDLAHTVTALQAQMTHMGDDVRQNQNRIEEFARQFQRVLQQLESLRTNMQWLTGAIVLGIVVVGILLLRVLGA